MLSAHSRKERKEAEKSNERKNEDGDERAEEEEKPPGAQWGSREKITLGRCVCVCVCLCVCVCVFHCYGSTLNPSNPPTSLFIFVPIASFSSSHLLSLRPFISHLSSGYLPLFLPLLSPLPFLSSFCWSLSLLFTHTRPLVEGGGGGGFVHLFGPEVKYFSSCRMDWLRVLFLCRLFTVLLLFSVCVFLSFFRHHISSPCFRILELCSLRLVPVCLLVSSLLFDLLVLFLFSVSSFVPVTSLSSSFLLLSFRAPSSLPLSSSSLVISLSSRKCLVNGHH